MFSGLKKMFGSEPKAAPPPAPAGENPSTSPATPPVPDAALPSGLAAFLCREPVFDRKNRPVGHLFRLHQTASRAALQRALDQALLDTLLGAAETPAGLVFVPLGSDSLDLPAVDRIASANFILLVELAPDADGAALAARLGELAERGIRCGLFRQPKNPAFALAIGQAALGAIDVAASDPAAVRDFSAAIRGNRQQQLLFACGIDTLDDHQLCLQWHYDYLQGRFAASAPPRPAPAGGDPHKMLLLNLMRLVQGEAETAEIAEAMKHDPAVAFRILRYLNSPALGLTHRIDSLSHALIILGRQRLTRWLSVLIFSVRQPELGDWLLVEDALTRARLMELLGAQLLPGRSTDPLFLTGVFSCLDRLLHLPLDKALDAMPLADDVRAAVLERRGPYAELLAVAEACASLDPPRMEEAARQVGLDAETLNRALLAATAWAAEVTEHWE
ncbi:EAL and HDOD domain-containing protein [Azonexus sp.]|uniref:EAL and HDOD domain-containing protein n=1 Tax=Azonexus sp. TaxID=1872668 RepID=UPI0035B104DE